MTPRSMLLLQLDKGHAAFINNMALLAGSVAGRALVDTQIQSIDCRVLMSTPIKIRMYFEDEMTAVEQGCYYNHCW